MSDENSYFDWLPKRGTTEWVRYFFPHPAKVPEAQVYWFQDGRVKVPAGWRILFKNGNDWKPVHNISNYDVHENAYNVVQFKPVTTVRYGSNCRCSLTIRRESKSGK